MTPKKIKTTQVQKSEYSDFLNKAKQFYDVMVSCLQNEEWDAVVLQGVHASISATDALLCFKVQIKSISKNHQDVTRLLKESMPSNEDVKKNADRLSQILNFKHAAEYESKRFTEREAYDFVKFVERYFQWIEKELP